MYVSRMCTLFFLLFLAFKTKERKKNALYTNKNKRIYQRFKRIKLRYAIAKSSLFKTIFSFLFSWEF